MILRFEVSLSREPEEDPKTWTVAFGTHHPDPAAPRLVGHVVGSSALALLGALLFGTPVLAEPRVTIEQVAPRRTVTQADVDRALRHEASKPHEKAQEPRPTSPIRTTPPSQQGASPKPASLWEGMETEDARLMVDEHHRGGHGGGQAGPGSVPNTVSLGAPTLPSCASLSVERLCELLPPRDLETREGLRPGRELCSDLKSEELTPAEVTELIVENWSEACRS